MDDDIFSMPSVSAHLLTKPSNKSKIGRVQHFQKGFLYDG